MTYPFREDVAKPRKRAKSTQQAAKNKADIVFSKIIRSVGRCEMCGTTGDRVQLQCAHWISRRYSNIRTDFDNAFCLCALCHFTMTGDPTAWSEWAVSKRGWPTYWRLREAGYKPASVDWPAELLRLREIAKREGIAV